ncbi:MAG: superfamily II DNA/RNA helicase [Thalassolituus sp.]|jgi:late competence protein required for DNA uptake (superfamily II DNA/RNA helicase)
MESVAHKDMKKLLAGEVSPFSYLKFANNYLASPETIDIGREYVIRALDEISLFNKNSETFKVLVRKSGLYPYLNKYFIDVQSDETKFLLELYESGIDGFIFHSMQAKVFNSIISGDNVILGAPTSMGKSAVVDALINSQLYSCIVIVVPTIALIDETRKRITKRFGHEYQIVYHGSQVQTRKRIVYVLTQERVNERDDLDNVDLFVIDEFYKLAFSSEDRSRVVALNIALSRLMTVSKQFFMIGPNIDLVRGMECFGREYRFIPTDFRTVATNNFKYNISPNDTEEKIRVLLDIIRKYKGQTIIYCKSQSEISRVFESIKDSLVVEFDFEFREWLARNYGSDWIFNRALKKGVGIHHGSLPRALQQKTVELFNDKKIRILICTSTLIEGVNTAAENVVIYDNRKASISIDSFTQKNISGRAGRMSQHLIGNVFSLEGDTKNENSSNVVELGVTQQEGTDSLGLIASIQSEHLTNKGKEELSWFVQNSALPLEVYQAHSRYLVTDIDECYRQIDGYRFEELMLFVNFNKFDSARIDLFVRFIKKAEYRSFQRMSLHFDDNNEFKNRFSWYLFSESHSDYVKNRIKYIYGKYSTAKLRSEETEKELKIVRNIFRYNVPSALMLFQDLLNYHLSLFDVEEKVDLGHILHVFENSHLISVFSAVEEAGVPIETLEKLDSERFKNSSLDVVTRYLRRFYQDIESLDDTDRVFIKTALF